MLSPSQCPDHLPLLGYVERVTTMPRSLVMFLKMLGTENDRRNAATQPSFATGFGEESPKKRNLLKGGLGLGPPVEVVDVVVTDEGPVGELLLAFHAQRLVGQPLFPPPQTYRKGAKTLLF